MTCIFHIWRSGDRDRPGFVMRLFPLYEREERRSVEVFPDEAALEQRLVELGFPKHYLATTFSNLRRGQDAMWTNIEITQAAFEGFGREGKDSAAA
jgi:hypothetical protein